MNDLIKSTVFTFLCIGFIIISVTSCKEQKRQVINKGEKVISPEYPKLFTWHAEDIDRYTSAIVMASDGHEYLYLNKDSQNESLEHYWNCKTCKK